MTSANKVVKKTSHSVNGKFHGWWVEFDTCLVYFAYRKGAGSKGYFRNADAWCIDLSTLNEAKYRGAKYIGVVHKTKKTELYITPIENLFTGYSQIHANGTVRQRMLSRQKWLVNPLTKEEYIKRAVKIR